MKSLMFLIMMSFLSKAVMAEPFNKQPFNTYKAYNRAVVIGTMINRKNIHGRGKKKVRAVGNLLNIGVPKLKDKQLFTGETRNIEANPESVYVRVNMINHGNINANTQGKSSGTALAIGNQINIQGARGIVSIKTQASNTGKINAQTNAVGNVKANAADLEINVKGNPHLVQIKGKVNEQGNISATAISGGVIAALKKAGEYNLR